MKYFLLQIHPSLVARYGAPSSKRANDMHAVLCLACVLLLCQPAITSAGIFSTPFVPGGQGGSINGQILSFGSGGEVFELDAFVNITGLDLNGASLGTSAQLSTDPLPAGLAFSFSTSLSPDTTDLTLTYTLTNNSAGTFNDVSFFSFVDAEIDVPINVSAT